MKKTPDVWVIHKYPLDPDQQMKVLDDIFFSLESAYDFAEGLNRIQSKYEYLVRKLSPTHIHL